MKKKHKQMNNKQTDFFKSKQQTQLVIKSAPSNNYSNTTIDVKYIVLHCTGYKNPLEVLEKNGVSCHYLIPEQAADELVAYEVVKPPLRAWHAGVSEWQGYQGLNDYAIGIEINMPNYARALENKTLDFLYFEPYQELQMQALKMLVKQLQSKYKISAKNIIGHSDIASFRNISGIIQLGKTDPGPTLPWQAFAEEGIGVWPSEAPYNSDIDLSATNAQYLLSQVGYKTTSSGEFDEETNDTIGAARLHWTPSCFNSTSRLANDCYTKPFDKVLANRLNNLAQKNYELSSSSASSLLLIITSVGAPILLLLLVCVFYKYCKNKKDTSKYSQFTSKQEQHQKNETLTSKVTL